MWATGTCRRTDPNIEQCNTKFPNLGVVVPVYRPTTSPKNNVEQLFYTSQLILCGENNSKVRNMKIFELNTDSPLTSILSTLLNDRLRKLPVSKRPLPSHEFLCFVNVVNFFMMPKLPVSNSSPLGTETCFSFVATQESCERSPSVFF